MSLASWFKEADLVNGWLHKTPNYPTDEATNARLWAAVLAVRVMGIDPAGPVTLEQMEEAYEYCNANGSIQFDENELQKQHKSGIEQRATQIREQREHLAGVAEDDSPAYALPLNEVRQRASNQLAGGLDRPDSILRPGSQFNRRGWSETPSRF